eukprot:TRINITY_DN52580_c0_g1_i1.p1 TRINITY_DN52580_c0_g1~~TRINITY_DN52580_c0_g1_i1.p1  ORF type:complete len:187 (+),score=26.17 TRINITY_DN52580_c0_g1_i1:143-703(+)
MDCTLVNELGEFQPNLRYDPGTPASNLGFLLQIFCQKTFVDEVRLFVQHHAAEFSCYASDGSHPLRWSELHHDFKKMFDDHLGAVLAKEHISKEELVSYIEELQEASRCGPPDTVIPASGGLKAQGVQTFLKNTTASEDYYAFLTVMHGARSAEGFGLPESACQGDCEADCTNFNVFNFDPDPRTS